MLEIEEAFNILEEEYKKQKTLLNKIHIIKEYLFDLEADLEEEKAENNEKAEIIKKAIQYIETCNDKKLLESMFLYEGYISNYGATELLDILRGNDDNNN